MEAGCRQSSVDSVAQIPCETSFHTNAKGGIELLDRLRAIGLATLVIASLQGCTINLGVTQNNSMTPDEQDFLACQMWFEGLPGVRYDTSLMSPESIGRAIEILDDRINVLEDVDSSLAMQVRRLQEEMRDDYLNIQRGVPSNRLPTNSWGMIKDCEKVLGISG